MEKRRAVLTPIKRPPIQEHVTANISSIPSLNQVQPSTVHKPQYTENIENGLIENKIYNRFIRLNNIQLGFQALKIMMCFTYFELQFKNNDYADFWLRVSLILHFISVFVRCAVERIRYQGLKAEDKIGFSIFPTILIITVTAGVYPQPWLTHLKIPMQYHDPAGTDYPYPYPLNYVLIIGSILLAIIKIMVGLCLNSIHNRPRAKRICKIYELYHQQLYAVKCIFKDRPIPLFAGIFMSAWLFFTFAFRVAEAPVPIHRNPFKYYQNCFWYSGVTASTTGFGDVTVRSDIGVYVTFLCGLWGNFNMSIMVVLILNILSLQQSQRKSLATSNKVSKQLERKKLSGEYISIALRRLWYNRKYKFDFRESLPEIRLKNKLAELRRQAKLSHPIEELTTHMQREFDRRLIQVDTLLDNNKSMLSYVGKDMFLKSQSCMDNSFSRQDIYSPKLKQTNKNNILVVESVHSLDLGSSNQSSYIFPKIQLHSPPASTRRGLMSQKNTS